METTMQPGAVAQPAEAGAQAPQPVSTICIAAMADGSFAVYPEGERPGQTVCSVDEALERAGQLLQIGGAGEPSGDAAAEALFQSGFAGARGA